MLYLEPKQKNINHVIKSTRRIIRSANNSPADIIIRNPRNLKRMTSDEKKKWRANVLEQYHDQEALNIDMD